MHNHLQKYCSYECCHKANDTPKPVQIKKCVVCGTEFETKRNNRKYCSNKCKFKFNRAKKRKEAETPNIETPKIEKPKEKIQFTLPGSYYKCKCVVCGKEMLRRTPNAIYCSNECSVKDGGKTPFKLTKKQKRQCEEIKMQLAIRRLEKMEI